MPTPWCSTTTCRPAQQRNLEQILGRTAIDRTAVILDIFAQNARTPEGRAQVELALLRYRLPRLRGRGTSLSQQAGGIGTRGPGETQLEVDRRRLVRRMTRLESDLRQLDRTRRTQRRGRRRGRGSGRCPWSATPTPGSRRCSTGCAGADVLVENRLFSTLDPRTRQLDLPGGETVLVTDTVGFVRKLPHQVVEAFRSTLEVVAESDLLVHVVDGSAPDLEGQIDAVRTVLAEIGADGLPELLVVNKADALGAATTAPGEEARRLLAAHPGSVMVSARTGEGIEELLVTMGDRLRVGDRVVELVIPWARGDVLAAVHREGEIVGEEAGEQATRIQVVLDDVGQAAVRGVPGLVTADRSRRRRPAADAVGRRIRAAPVSLRSAQRIKARAEARFADRGGLVDCSIGTPCDPPPPSVLAAMATSGTERGYPASPGSPAYRRAAAGWLAAAVRRVGRPRPCAGGVRRHQGVRGLGRPVPPSAHPRTGTRSCTRPSPIPPTPWGRPLAGCRPVPVPELPGGGLDLDAVDPRRRRPGPGAVGQLPLQPDRAAHRPRARGRVGAGPRDPGLLRRVLRRVHLGRPAPDHPVLRRRRAWWPSTRCRSAPTWPGCGRGSSPATPTWSASCSTSGATPG